MKKKIAAIVSIALVLPVAASARIVPQRGIAGVTLDMTQAQVRAKLGSPDRVAHRNAAPLGRYTTWFYGKTSIDMRRAAGAKVFNISTTSSSQRTAAGAGVGSTAAQVEKAVKGARCDTQHCFIGRFNPGRKVTDFTLSKSGRVTRVTIGYVLD